jgi:hypothetical protein
MPGLVRFAALAPKGFPDGQLYVMRFVALRVDALASLTFKVDEMHTATRADAAKTLVVRPRPLMPDAARPPR